MNDLLPLQFETHTIRVITGEDGEPLFVAKDIAVALEYKDTSQAVRQHCKGALIQRPLQTPGGIQEVRVIKEPDVYRLIIKSTMPEAVKFEAWLMDEVLPAIRKTGGYQVQQAPMTLGDTLVAQAEAFREVERQLALVQAQQSETSTLLGQTSTRLDQIETAGEHFTIIGWSRLNGRTVTLPMASSMGGKATKYCKEQGIQTGSVPDARFGRANTYPKNVLDYLFTETEVLEH